MSDPDTWPSVEKLQEASLNQRIQRDYQPRIDDLMDSLPWYTRLIIKTHLRIIRRRARNRRRP